MRIRILVADDQPALRLLLHEYLNADYEVCEAEDGLRAVEAVRQQVFDLVLMDIHMPKMNGLEALEQIKQLRPGTVVFLMTALGTVELAREAIRRKADDFITKPINLEELKADIDHALEHQVF